MKHPGSPALGWNVSPVQVAMVWAVDEGAPPFPLMEWKDEDEDGYEAGQST